MTHTSPIPLLLVAVNPCSSIAVYSTAISNVEEISMAWDYREVMRPSMFEYGSSAARAQSADGLDDPQDAPKVLI